MLLIVCKRNDNANRLATPLFKALWGGEGRCGTNWLTEVVEIAALYEFDNNDRFFTTSCDPFMGHTL
jgi:hypothetical protein